MTDIVEQVPPGTQSVCILGTIGGGRRLRLKNALGEVLQEVYVAERDLIKSRSGIVVPISNDVCTVEHDGLGIVFA